MNAIASIRESIDSADWRSMAQKLFDELRVRTGDGRGITRECYAEGEQAALDLFRETAEAHGLKASYDKAANLFITLPDDDGKKPAIILGSHADSVPQGGNFDGGAGVVAGLLCLIRLLNERPSAPSPSSRSYHAWGGKRILRPRKYRFAGTFWTASSHRSQCQETGQWPHTT